MAHQPARTTPTTAVPLQIHRGNNIFTPARDVHDVKIPGAQIHVWKTSVDDVRKHPYYQTCKLFRKRTIHFSLPLDFSVYRLLDQDDLLSLDLHLYSQLPTSPSEIGNIVQARRDILSLLEPTCNKFYEPIAVEPHNRRRIYLPTETYAICLKYRHHDMYLPDRIPETLNGEELNLNTNYVTCVLSQYRSIIYSFPLHQEGLRQLDHEDLKSLLSSLIDLESNIESHWKNTAIMGVKKLLVDREEPIPSTITTPHTSIVLPRATHDFVNHVSHKTLHSQSVADSIFGSRDEPYFTNFAQTGCRISNKYNSTTPSQSAWSKSSFRGTCIAPPYFEYPHEASLREEVDITFAEYVAAAKKLQNYFDKQIYTQGASCLGPTPNIPANRIPAVHVIPKPQQSHHTPIKEHRVTIQDIIESGFTNSKIKVERIPHPTKPQSYHETPRPIPQSRQPPSSKPDIPSTQPRCNNEFSNPYNIATPWAMTVKENKVHMEFAEGDLEEAQNQCNQIAAIVYDLVKLNFEFDGPDGQGILMKFVHAEEKRKEIQTRFESLRASYERSKKSNKENSELSGQVIGLKKKPDNGKGIDIGSLLISKSGRSAMGPGETTKGLRTKRPGVRFQTQNQDSA
ncbi:hypothetical protein B0J11DRAFT_575599 [Dendryphion nanum]|uniref:Uncharacterized protein n=1 Tax=Dendryphion nanum TaxID=256645 RepID=A0A9P9IXW5_9PLEO|nr:hypothetical protein B0J11DRAFT_575599 [Dendryphion nanum]